MLPQQKPYLTPDEYLILERQAETKSEYWNGQAYAMADASRQHTTIAANTLAQFVTQLRRRPCTAHGSDLRVKVTPTGLYTYPDIVVVCGKAQFEDRRQDTLLNPTVIVEVLLPTTEAYDRGAKFEFYRMVESLTDYLLIAQDRPAIEHYVRQPDDKWLLSAYSALDAVVHVGSIACDLRLTDVYDKVEWPTAEASLRGLRLVKEPGAEYLPG